MSKKKMINPLNINTRREKIFRGATYMSYGNYKSYTRCGYIMAFEYATYIAVGARICLKRK